MSIGSIKRAISGVILVVFATMSSNAIAEGIETYIGGGITYSNSDCGGRTVIRGNTGASGSPASTDFMLATTSDCDAEVGYQVNGGADYKTDSGLLLGVEIGYLSQEFDAELRNTTVNGGNDNTATSTDRATITQPSDTKVDTFFYGIRLGASLLDDRLDAYVRGGFHSYDAESATFRIALGLDVASDATLANNLIGAVPADDGTDVYYGIGIEYDVWEENGHGLGVRLDYTRYHLGDFGDLDVVSLTGQYEFGHNY